VTVGVPRGPAPEPPAEPIGAADDVVGAFVPADGLAVTLPGRPGGSLGGLGFAASDVFAVPGRVTGAGNPDWSRTHAAATELAVVLDRLTTAGAALAGLTVTDELSFGLFGVNPHHGTPRNPLAPDSLPGGASSGAAAATAAGLVDFAVGLDSGGSVLVPASLCGLYGVRPTPGRVPRAGTFTLAPSFDAVGWMARDPEVLWQVTTALLGGGDPGPPVTRAVLPDDAWAVADDEVVDAMLPELQRLGLRLTMVHEPALAPGGLAGWADALALLQAREAWVELGGWLTAVNPTVALEVKHRLDAARDATGEALAGAEAARRRATDRLHDLVGPDTVVVLPTTPEISPLLDAGQPDLASFRARVLRLVAPAALGGLPQVTIPLVQMAEYPVGLSLVGAPGRDEAVVSVAATVARPAD
jgi:amidase